MGRESCVPDGVLRQLGIVPLRHFGHLLGREVASGVPCTTWPPERSPGFAEHSRLLAGLRVYADI
jgi:hypothetical protein